MEPLQTRLSIENHETKEETDNLFIKQADQHTVSAFTRTRPISQQKMDHWKKMSRRKERSIRGGNIGLRIQTLFFFS